MSDDDSEPTCSRREAQQRLAAQDDEVRDHVRGDVAPAATWRGGPATVVPGSE